MSVDHEQFWRAVLGNLEVSLSKPNFTTWFKNTSILESSDKDVTIGVPNTFTKEWLHKKYHQSIVHAVRSINPDIREIRYEISSSSKAGAAVSSRPSQTHAKARPVASEMKVSSQNNSFLNPKYNFNNFIVGGANELAHAAATAIVSKPGTSYNPLFIYGGVGLGKTHLMQAVGNKLLSTNPNQKVLYVSAERFTNEFIQAIKDGRGHDFKKHYRTVDLLLIDDVQLLAGKEQTQEEFFHTFNTLYNTNKQIVLTSDRLPKEIPSIQERLISRFEGGMVADVQAPNLETRIAILNSKVKEKNYELSPEVVSFIASNVESNIRELEGALNRIVVHSQMHNAQPTLEKTKDVLSSLISQPKKRGLTPKKIMEASAVYYNVTMEDLIKQSRRKEFVKPRQVAMYLIRKELETSLPSIGEFFGGRDHTTVIHAVHKVGEIVKTEESFKQDLAAILDKACL